MVDQDKHLLRTVPIFGVYGDLWTDQSTITAIIAPGQNNIKKALCEVLSALEGFSVTRSAIDKKRFFVPEAFPQQALSRERRRSSSDDDSLLGCRRSCTPAISFRPPSSGTRYSSISRSH
jgi:hypothetical protein